MSASFPVRQAPDRVRTRTIVLVAIVGVLVTVLASAVPGWMLERRGQFHLDAPTRAADLPVAPREIDLLDQTLLEGADAAASSPRAAQRRRLERYGFVDRERGVVHIPIERAMDLVVREHAGPRSHDDGGAP